MKSVIRKSKIPIVLLLSLVSSLAVAQALAPRIFKAARSPEVDANNRVTFRYFAPNANKVVVCREEGVPLAMAKDKSGIWSITTEPLTPDIYSYYFLVDGVQYADTANENSKTIVTGGNESLVHVPGSTSLDWEEANVPHGIVHHHRYRSSVLGENHNFVVYTPAGYNPSQKKTYPTLYLLHGVMEDENAWVQVGRANVILDNLIAQKRTKPMIIVMPSSYGFANAPNKVGDVLTGKANHHRDFERFSKLMLEDIIPEVERNYRVGKERSIAGTSMGGAESLYLGLNHPNAFGEVASFSGAFLMYGSKLDDWFPMLSNKKKLPALTLSCGSEDFLLSSNASMKKWLNGKEVAFNAVETQGGHTWPVWRRNLIAYVTKLFLKN